MAGKNKWHEWAAQVAAKLMESMPVDYMQMWANDETYIFPFHELRPLKKKEKCINWMIHAENKATEVLNQYQTQLVREELKKIFEKEKNEK